MVSPLSSAFNTSVVALGSDPGVWIPPMKFCITFTCRTGDDGGGGGGRGGGGGGAGGGLGVDWGV